MKWNGFSVLPYFPCQVTMAGGLLQRFPGPIKGIVIAQPRIYRADADRCWSTSSCVPLRGSAMAFPHSGSNSGLRSLMIGTAKILAICEDTDVSNLISSLELEDHKATCATSPHEALQLLRRGLVAEILLIHAAKNRSKELSLSRRFRKTSTAKNCASSPSRNIRQRQNRRFMRRTEGKCEPVYTTHAVCVALWARQRRQPAILRDLQLFRLVWKLHPCDGNESRGLQALPGYRTALDNTLCKPAGLNAPHTTIGTGPDFPKMIFRVASSAVRFERGGRIGASMFKVSETQGSIGNHLLCALQKELARLRLRDMLCK
jgi:hypothetical protein